MSVDQSPIALLALDELPDEVLLLVLAGAGTRAILRAAACCRRLRSLSHLLRTYRCFSAAASTKPDIHEALAEACERALQGMLGCVDFALLFVSNHEPAGRGALAASVVEGLRGQLPPGTCVVGCATAGLMGVGPGGPRELDPADEDTRGVALLLGRMPGCRVAPFCSLHPDPAAAPPPAKRGAASAKAADAPPPATQAANAAAIAWLTRRRDNAAASATTVAGATCATSAAPSSAAPASAAPAPASPSASSLGLQSAWLLQAGSHAAFTLLSGPGGLLTWMQADEQALPVIAGGVSSGSGDLFFHPALPPPAHKPAPGREEQEEEEEEGGGPRRGRRRRAASASAAAAAAAVAAPEAGPGGASEVPGWDPARRGLQYVGLAVMAAQGGEQAPGGGGAGERRLQGTALEPAGPMEAEGQGAAAMAMNVDAVEEGGVKVAAPPAAAAAPMPASAVRACAVALRGCGGLPGQPVWVRVGLERQRLGQAAREDSEDDEEEEEEGELVSVTGGTPVPAPGSLPDPSGAGASTGSGTGPAAAPSGSPSAPAPALPRSLADSVKAEITRTRSLPYVALWAAPMDDPSLASGLNAQVFRSGRLALGQPEPRLLAAYGIVAFSTPDRGALEAIEAAAAGGAVLACQLADITPQGCRQHLHAELPLLRSICSTVHALPSGSASGFASGSGSASSGSGAVHGPGCPDPRRWEGYAVLRRGAAAAGARSGPVGLAVFSCTGRGRAIFGEAGTECEASIADEVLQRCVPFVGAYCNGELGPHVRGGYAGWALSPVCEQLPAVTTRGSVGAAGAEGAEAEAGGRGGGRPPRDKTCMQGFTSVYAALG